VSAPGYPLLVGHDHPRLGGERPGDGPERSVRRQADDLRLRRWARYSIEEDLITARTSELRGIEADMNALPDQVLTMAIAACFRGGTIIKNALTAR